MTEHYRGLSREPGPSRWLRGRWKYRSVLVLDIDHIICDANCERGLLIEWKHESAADKTWNVTRRLAEKLDWYAALFVYATDDGTNSGTVIEPIMVTFSYRNHRSKPYEMNFAGLDLWVREQIGALPVEAA